MRKMLFGTIVADPPWRYNSGVSALRSGGKGAQAEHHYPTMTNEELALLPIKGLSAEQAHLYLWVTVPRLIGDWQGSRETTPFDIVESWGFRPITMLTWVKEGRPGPGWYFRGQTEHVIFATRGDLGIPAERRVKNVFSAPKVGHSSKPGMFFDMVERISPGPFLELFSRSSKLGWTSLGNEVPIVANMPLSGVPAGLP